MTWQIAYFPAAVAASAGNGVPAGVFIPAAGGLPGVNTGNELNDANKERKVAYALATQVYDVLSAQTNKLGITVARPTPAGVADNRINQTFTYTSQFMVNHVSNEVSVLPLPISLAGQVTLDDLFDGATIVAAEGAVPAAGIVIPDETVEAYGGGSTAGYGGALNATNTDARGWLNALYFSLVQDLQPNAALVSASRGAAVGFVPPANFAGNAAITGIAPNELPLRSFFSITYSLTLQLLLNQSAQTFDLAS